MAVFSDGARFAFNAMLDIDPHAHGDLEASWKMSGYGGTEGPFMDLDDTMCDIVVPREDVDCARKDGGVELPAVRPRWAFKDAEVGLFKTGRLNKQQRDRLTHRRLNGSSRGLKQSEGEERQHKIGLQMRFKS
jgi:hypothetical protein